MNSICDSCKWSHIIWRGEAKIINCSSLSKIVPNDIDKCSEYKDKKFVAKHELVDIAWLLDPNKRIAGFVKPGEAGYKELKSDPINHYDPD